MASVGAAVGVGDAQSGQPISLLAQVNRVARGSNNVNMTLTEFLLHVKTDHQQYYIERLKEYEAMLHVIGVLAGVLGTQEEQTQLRQAVMTAVEDYLQSIDVDSDPEGLYLENAEMVFIWTFARWFGWDEARELIEEDGRRAHEANQMTKRMITDLFKSIWSSLVDWLDKFWKTYDEEGLLIALSRAKIDAQFFAAECALDIAISAALAGAGVVVAAALKGLRFVGQRVGRGVTRIVIHAIPDNAKHVNPQAKVLHQLDLPDDKIDPSVDRLLDEDRFKLPEQPTTPKPSTPQTTRIKGDHDNHTNPIRADRSVDEILEPYGGKIPSVRSGKFGEFFDKLSPTELAEIRKNGELLAQLNRQLRHPGGKHEWLKVSEIEHIKRLGFRYEEIRDWRTDTRETRGSVPQRFRGQGQSIDRWQHSPETGTGSGQGSGRMHAELDNVIRGSKDRDDLLRRLGDFLDEWLDGGVETGIPDNMRDAIMAARNNSFL